MTAIPKALAIANPKHVAACVTTVAGVITSKFAIDAVANKIKQTGMDKVVIPERPYYAQTNEETDDES